MLEKNKELIATSLNAFELNENPTVVVLDFKTVMMSLDHYTSTRPTTPYLSCASLRQSMNIVDGDAAEAANLGEHRLKNALANALLYKI